MSIAISLPLSSFRGFVVIMAAWALRVFEKARREYEHDIGERN